MPPVPSGLSAMAAVMTYTSKDAYSCGAYKPQRVRTPVDSPSLHCPKHATTSCCDETRSRRRQRVWRWGQIA